MSRVLLVVLASAVSPPASANEAYLAAESVTALAVDGPLPRRASDAVWGKAKPLTVTLAVQRTVRLNDADANALLGAPPRRATVRALSNRKELALLVEWPDGREDRAAADETAAFGDGVAVELPLRFGPGVRLPYVGMGDDAEPVLVRLCRAGVGSQLQHGAYIAAGFGSLTRRELPWWSADLAYDTAGRRWRALFLRPLTTPEHDVARGLVPFALAVWDGAHEQRGGNKLLSGWRVVRLPGLPVDATYLGELAFGYGKDEQGDAAAGKAFVDAVCSTCHHFADKHAAPPELGPDLGNIGVIASAAYLRDSLVAPSAVIVPSLNANLRYDKAGGRDAHGAYPNSELRWDTTDPATGAKTSKMPPFAALPREALMNAIAYLKTLGQAPRQ